MLGKLMKYEIKAGLRLLPIVYLAIAGFYTLGLLAKAFDIIQIRMTMSVLLVIGGAAAVIMTLVFVILRFYKGLYSAEGYLAQTLPVSSGSLIAAKVITAYLWMLLSFIVAFLAVLSMLQLNDIKKLNELIKIAFGGSFTPLVIYFALSFFVQLLSFLGELYFAITLSNTRYLLRNSALFSIIFYFVANFAVSLLELVAMLFVPLGIIIKDKGVEWTTQTMAGSLALNWNVMNSQQPLVSNISVGIGNILADVIGGVALLLLARWLMTHKATVK